MGEEIKYRTFINSAITDWENNDPSITEQLTVAYGQLLIDNKLDPCNYKSVIYWTYVNDDFAQNRITLIIEAVKIKIAVCITTTPNRKELFAQSFLHLCENTPLDVSYKVYSDDNYEGISKAKNKCLAMCDGFDFVFLLDDDIFSLDINWTEKYINSGLDHAMYIFDRNIKYEACEIHNGSSNKNYISYDLPRGCMLFLTRKAIDTAGGMDEDFKVWGYEHAEYSRRIYNMALTPAPFIDIPNSDKLFYAYDQWQSNISSVTDEQRIKSIPANYALYQQKFYSKEFKPFK